MKKVSILAALTAAAVLLISCGTTEEAAKAAPAPAPEPVAAPAPAPAAEEVLSGIIFSGEVTKDAILVENNHQYGKNYQSLNGAGMVLPKNYVAQAGDIITLHIEGTWSSDIIEGGDDDGNPIALGIWIVDQCPQASYWTPLTDVWKTDTLIKAGEPFVMDYEFSVHTDAKIKAGARGADVTFYTSTEQAEDSVLSITSFTYEIERP